MLKGTLRGMARFLLSVSEDRPKKAAPSEDWDGFSRRARQIARSRQQALLAGSIEFLGLEEITDGMQPTAWGHELRQLSERIIRQHLGHLDTYAKRGEDSFVLCFASPDPRHAKETLQRIIEEIKAAAATGASVDDLEIAHDVVEIDVEDVEDAGAEQLFDTIAQSLRRLRDETESASRSWRQHLLSSASVSFHPVWLSRRKVVAIHRAVLDDDTGRCALRRLSSLSSAEEMRGTLFEIDSLILGRATGALHNLVGDGGRTQLVVPLYYASIDSKNRRQRYQQLCENIPQAYRRFLLFEVHDIPQGTPSSQFAMLITALNKFSHGVLLESCFGQTTMPAAMGCAGIVSRVPHLSLRPADFARRAERFASAAASAGLKSFLYGVDTPDLVRLAAEAGVDYLQGSAIAKSTKELKDHYRWELRLAS